MKMKTEVTIQEFEVPVVVYVSISLSGGAERRLIGFNLSEIPASALAILCDNFRAAVFQNAGKTDPAEFEKFQTVAQNTGD